MARHILARMTRQQVMQRLSGLLLQRSGLLNAKDAAVAPSLLRFKSALAEASAPGSLDHLHEKDGKVLHPELLNEQVLTTQYAGEAQTRCPTLHIS